jgi:hypothetical protein
VKKFLISAAVLTCMGSAAYAADEEPPPVAPEPERMALPPIDPPPIGWVYGPYTECGDDPPQCSMVVVSAAADGLNVRVGPNGPPVLALLNGTPVIPMRQEGDWLLVRTACDITPMFAWLWTSGVPLWGCGR